jgi:hypothetical protein
MNLVKKRSGTCLSVYIEVGVLCHLRGVSDLVHRSTKQLCALDTVQPVLGLKILTLVGSVVPADLWERWRFSGHDLLSDRQLGRQLPVLRRASSWSRIYVLVTFQNMEADGVGLLHHEVLGTLVNKHEGVEELASQQTLGDETASKV